MKKTKYYLTVKKNDTYDKIEFSFGTLNKLTSFIGTIMNSSLDETLDFNIKKVEVEQDELV